MKVTLSDVKDVLETLFLSDNIEDRFETHFRRNGDPFGVLFKIK
jgi:hypothetical protein